jgi:hypothetical protein
VLFKTKSKGPFRPLWFNENSDYPLVWFTAMVEIIDVQFRYKTKQEFDINLLKDMTYKNMKPHITLSLLALKGVKNNNCNYKLGYNPNEEKITLNTHTQNSKIFNTMIKKLNKYKDTIFTSYTNVDDKEFLAYFIKKDATYKSLEKDSISVLNHIFQDIIQ